VYLQYSTRSEIGSGNWGYGGGGGGSSEHHQSGNVILIIMDNIQVRHNGCCCSHCLQQLMVALVLSTADSDVLAHILTLCHRAH
jgi:hypothetical protein